MLMIRVVLEIPPPAPNSFKISHGLASCGTIYEQKTVILLGRKDNDTEVQESIDTYLAINIDREQICIHADNGGDSLCLYGARHLLRCSSWI